MKAAIAVFFIFVCILCTCSVYAYAGRLEAVSEDDAQSQPRIWALLAAGSNGYEYYRHQADICHAYQVLHRHGVPDERIVVMMYDDIAYNSMNPTPGVLVNHPNGSNVYEGVPKDYTGSNITSNNFLKVLKGDKEGMHGIGSGKVIDSKPEDHIFVFVSDLGGIGCIQFIDDLLYSSDLADALKEMHAKKRFAKLVFYLEASNSGSMFSEDLPDNINVFATTAASPSGDSYVCYWDAFRKTYLGDLYSVSWMEDSDVKDLANETLQEQYKIVKQKTNTSTVQEYGDLSVGEMTLSMFQGYKKAEPLQLPRVPRDAVDSLQAPIASLKRQIETAPDSVIRMKLLEELEELLSKRRFLETTITEIVEHLKYDRNVFEKRVPANQDRDCYRQVVDHFNKVCFRLSRNPYALAFVHIFGNMCASTRPNKAAEILATLDTVCVHPRTEDIV